MIKDNQKDQTSAYAVLTYAGVPRSIKLKTVSCMDEEL